VTFADAHLSLRKLTLLSDAKLRALWDVCGAVAGVPGDCAELGVYRGGVGRLMSLRCPTRTVRLFDTFTGIPWDGYDVAEDGHRPGEFAADYFEVRQALADRPNVVLHPGLFPGTATGESFAVVHLDADLYASTKAGLEWFWPRLSVGGAITLDDWRWRMCPGVERAVGEFFADKPGAKMLDTAEFQLTVFKA
jgi:O-methyltransferase